MDLMPSETIVIENAPLGVETTIKQGLIYIVTLNNTPLDISSDFKDTLFSMMKSIRYSKIQSLESLF